MKLPFRRTVILVASCCVPASGMAQDRTPPCRRAQLDHVSFLAGEWRVHVRERVGPGEDDWRERDGNSSWSWQVEGCVLVEQLSLGDGSRPYSETRLLAFDHRAEEWDLVVVDSEHGNLVTMTGRATRDGLEFTDAQSRRGRLLLDRVRLRRLRDDQLEYVVESSFDAGAEWVTLVVVNYSRPHR